MNIPYRISEIKTTQFAIFPEKVQNGKEMNVRADFSYGINKPHNSVRCVCKISYLQDEELLMVLEVLCLFEVAPEGVVQIEKDKKIPVDFLRYVATIVVGTARGIIHARTENTVLNPYVLPPINLINLIKDDMVIE